MSIVPSYNRAEHDYVLKYVRLVPQDPSKTPNGQGYFDFTSHFVEFSFEESVFEVGVHGSMLVKDAVDYPTLLPMIGEERMQICFTRIDESDKGGSLLEPIEFDLPIYQMGARRQEGKSRKRQSYTLYYGSESIFRNMNAVVCRMYKNMTYSDMVSKIYTDFLQANNKPIVIEPTQYSTNYFVQNLSPLKAIRNIAQRSISAENNGYFYVFFEDRDQFNFVTLNKLSQQEPIKTLSYKPKNVADDSPYLAPKNKDVPDQLYNADIIKNEQGYDVIGQAMSGEGSSSLLSVDCVRRKFALQAFDLRGEEAAQKSHALPLVSNSSWEKFKHMESAKPWKDTSKMFVNPLANLSVLVSDSGHESHEYIATRDTEARSYFPEEFFLQRKSNKAQMMRHIISTTLSGDPRIKAGCTIKFDIPEYMGKVNDQNPEKKDAYLQGKYLVVSVAHIITKEAYTMNLELIRDSYFSDIEARDPVEEYKHIY